MSAPFHFFNMVAVGAQSDVAGVAIGQQDLIGGFVQIQHLVMREETTSYELKAPAAF
ncbi:hypothetical protein [Rhodoferax antarcticus]|uniref:hypothetical protein n=1 Tax=Rhodoferax antarcticus TaxID=81479 RepID=UPI0018E94988